MGQEMAMVDETWVLNQLIFIDREVGVRTFAIYQVICFGPSDADLDYGEAVD